MLRKAIQHRRVSKPPRKRRGNLQTRKRRASKETRKRGRRASTQERKARKKRKRRKLNKKKRSRGANLRWLTASLRTSTGKGKFSPEMPYIAKDVYARPFFWQEEIICFW